MSPDTPDLRAVVERLAKMETQNRRVERQNRRLKQAGMAVPVLCAAFLLMGQSASKRTVTAEEFVLHDRAGNRRGELTVTEKGPGLALYDPNGMLRAEMGVHETDPVLVLYDAAGIKQASLYATEIGPGFFLYDVNGKARVGLEMTGSGPSIRLLDKRGKNRAILGAVSLQMVKSGQIEREPSSSLVLIEADGRVSFQAP